MKKSGMLKKCLSVILGAIIATAASSNVFAHEIYHDNAGPVVLKWNNLQNRIPYLKVNGDYLEMNLATPGFPYLMNLDDSITVWNNLSKVRMEKTVFAQSTVDMATASPQYWDSRFKNDNQKMLGITDLSTTDGLVLNEDVAASDVRNSSKRIKYAAIYMTPYELNFFGDHAFIIKTMVHELGHALTLGHPDYGVNSSTSVMRQGFEGYNMPQSHDISDINAKY